MAEWLELSQTSQSARAALVELAEKLQTLLEMQRSTFRVGFRLSAMVARKG
jgi:hypothetical protein